MLKGYPAAIECTESLRKQGAVFYTSTINLYEVICGIKNLPRDSERHSEALQLLTSRVHVLNFDSEAAMKGADIKHQLRVLGKPIGGIDYLIAASACSNGIDMMVSQNKKHFENIKEIKQVLTY